MNPCRGGVREWPLVEDGVTMFEADAALNAIPSLPDALMAASCPRRYSLTLACRHNSPRTGLCLSLLLSTLRSYARDLLVIFLPARALADYDDLITHDRFVPNRQLTREHCWNLSFLQMSAYIFLSALLGYCS